MHKQSSKIVVVFFISYYFFIRCSEKQVEVPIVAKVGSQTITQQDVVESFYLFPKFQPNKKGRQAIEQHLDGLISNKLLAAEGENRGYLEDARIKRRLKWVKKNAMVKQLYREKVREKVNVTEDELRAAFAQKQIQIRARHLFVETLEQAQHLRQRLLTGESFDQLAREVFAGYDLAENGGDLGFFSWGEMDPDFESAAYSLKIGEISEPVRTQWGYHIIRVDDVHRNAIVTEEEFIQERESIAKTIRRRKEEALAAEYVAEVMQGLDVRAKGPMFAVLVDRAQKIVQAENSPLPKKIPTVDDLELGEIHHFLEEHLDEVFVSFKGGQWSLGNFLERLEAMPPAFRPHLSDPERFKVELKDMIRDEFLAKQAENMKLGSHPNIRKQLRWWQEELLAAKMKKELINGVKVTPGEVDEYFSTHQDFSDHHSGEPKMDDIAYQLLIQKQDSVINAFVEKLKTNILIKVYDSELAVALEKLGGDEAGFMVVWNPRQY